jgi:glycosyltransferase involved in cell wall biosynthesis
MPNPLVTVICLCYNQERFVREAMNSVLGQTYQNIQVIVVDDGSSDNSRSVIRDVIGTRKDITFIPLDKNQGNCKAFNIGFSHAQGDLIIDFAADDVMLPDKIEKQVRFFSTLPDEYGVVFTDAMYIDSSGKTIRKHFDYLLSKGLLKEVYQGDVYSKVISTFFIPSPSMMVRKEVFDWLRGYDENLAYEDFDFWVRSSRKFRYAFLNEVTVKIRKTENSMSTRQYSAGDRQLHSTYLVCRKVLAMNRSTAENDALIKRVRFEIRQSVLTGNKVEAKLFLGLLREMNAASVFYELIVAFAKLNLPLTRLRNFYHSVRY